MCLYKILVTLVLLVASNLVHAQREQGFFVELFGASTTLGIHYDSRFNDQTKWGGRFGVAFTNSHSQDFFVSSPESTRGWSFPIAVNYLIGNGRHQVEAGVGVSYGFYNCKYHDKEGREVEYERSGVFGFLDMGYRYQSETGIMVRVGLNPGVALGRHDQLGRSDHGVDRAAVIYPYISVGYCF
jgi:hypothetical protein